MTGGGKACLVCKIVGLIVAIGALNWGLVGLLNLNLVEKVLGMGTAMTRIVYIVIGVAGVMKLLWLAGMCPCTKGSCETK